MILLIFSSSCIFFNMSVNIVIKNMVVIGIPKKNVKL